MAKTATPSITVTVAGDGIANATYSPQNIAANANAAPPSYVSLASGTNTIAVPSIGTPAAVLIIPPPSSAVSKTYRGASGDTGFTGTNQWVVVPVTGMSNIYINAASTEAGVLLVWM
jgi:hypothetical protein